MILFLILLVLVSYLILGVGNVLAKDSSGHIVTKRTAPLSILLWPVELYRISRFSSKGPF